MSVVLRRTVWDDIDWRFDDLSGSHLQSQVTLKMTSAQVVETSVNVISNSPSQDCTHPDDRTLLYDMTPGFKPFTINAIYSTLLCNILCNRTRRALWLVKNPCFINRHKHIFQWNFLFLKNPFKCNDLKKAFDTVDHEVFPYTVVFPREQYLGLFWF